MRKSILNADKPPEVLERAFNREIVSQLRYRHLRWLAASHLADAVYAE